MSGYGIEIMNRVGSATTSGNAIDRFDRLEKLNAPTAADKPDGEKSFGNVLKGLIDDVRETQTQADNAAEGLVSGRNKDIHGAMIAMEKADVSLRLLTQVRNKVIDAYREIMRMQV